MISNCRDRQTPAIEWSRSTCARCGKGRESQAILRALARTDGKRLQDVRAAGVTRPPCTIWMKSSRLGLSQPPSVAWLPTTPVCLWTFHLP